MVRPMADNLTELETTPGAQRSVAVALILL